MDPDLFERIPALHLAAPFDPKCVEFEQLAALPPPHDNRKAPTQPPQKARKCGHAERGDLQ
ncbi:hypothetical protein GCM10027031_03310 [Corynebacterium atrinae]